MQQRDGEREKESGNARARLEEHETGGRGNATDARCSSVDLFFTSVTRNGPLPRVVPASKSALTASDVARKSSTTISPENGRHAVKGHIDFGSFEAALHDFSSRISLNFLSGKSGNSFRVDDVLAP